MILNSKRCRPRKYKPEEKEQKYRERALSYYHDHRQEIIQKKKERYLNLSQFDDDTIRQIEAIINRVKSPNKLVNHNLLHTMPINTSCQG